MAALGYSVPQPELNPNKTNPRGFGEPRWAVLFQEALLREARVTNLDGRPYAWRPARQVTEADETTDRLREWLSEQFDQSTQVVVKDPRTVWFLPLWRRVSDELALDLSCVTLLRPPAEVVASARRWYNPEDHDTSWLCGWMNVQTRTEKQTRDIKRAFVRYSDLLADWRTVFCGLDDRLDLGLDLDSDSASKRVDEWLDPDLRREQATLDDLELPAMVRSLIDRLWTELDGAVEEDDDARRSRLDQLRAEYRRMYLEAESIAQSTIVAARKKRLPARGEGPGAGDRPITAQVVIADNASASRFEIVVDGELAGHAEYHDGHAGRAFTHTEIAAEHEGLGLASQLIRHALDEARAGGRRVLPFCPFVRAFIERHPDYLDLVDDPNRFGLSG
jgi:predicted GNAT family acetyltransferase